jgi:hypothetical protein
MKSARAARPIEHAAELAELANDAASHEANRRARQLASIGVRFFISSSPLWEKV